MTAVFAHGWNFLFSFDKKHQKPGGAAPQEQKNPAGTPPDFGNY
jgi:hypothetical protein